MPALPSPKRDMQAGNDETDRLQLILGDTVGIQPKNDQILALAKTAAAREYGHARRGQPK